MNMNIINTGNEQGQSISVVGDTYRILISGEQTGGNYAVIDMLVVPPGGGPGPHAHKDMQEMFYVVEGEIDFKMQSGSYTAKKGAFVNIPLGGAVHSFKNKTDTVAHLLCTVVPAGLESFFKEIGKPIAAGEFLTPQPPTSEELNKLQQLAEKYGQKLYPPNFLD
ncbi:cupin domain-containing protein [Adhaeribacter radiodurans]|uniref:Cupin domain-containing protein n=1 Tax=Adhaeribacter radiodurans TaxID=2745197 RepID=A0A7L7LDJ6_9BACT|nr:cupin domain-containing protein [Adhaeribacter radiodurans]QMU30605.1 cupin domain-containing protein [Adhaeribacter radiodurans]